MFTTQQFSHATRTLLMALAIVSLSCSGVAFAADQSQNDSGNDNAADSGQAQQATGNDGSNDQNQDDQSNQENKSDQQGQADQQDQTQQDDQQTFIEMQESSQVLASSLIGMSVQNQSSDEGEEIGTVNDLILNEQHQVVGIVVGVGGFLGIGEKNVGSTWNAVENVDGKRGV